MNTHGGKGRNLPCDLHNEHVNRLYKQLIANSGAIALVLQEQCPPLRGLLLVLRDRQASIQRQLITAGIKSDAKDVQIIVEVVLKARMLEVIDKRCQSKFPNFSPNPLDRIERDTYTCLSNTHVHSNSIYNPNTYADVGEGRGGGGYLLLNPYLGVHNQWL